MNAFPAGVIGRLTRSAEPTVKQTALACFGVGQVTLGPEECVTHFGT